MWWLVLSIFQPILAFDGEEYWAQNILDQCKNTDNGDWSRDPALRCYIVHDKLHFFKLEVLSTKPIVLRYHQIIHRRLCKRVLQEVDALKLYRAGVVSTDPNKPMQVMSNRMANSSWVPHRELEHFNHMFNTLQRSIIALDLSKAEQFNVLSYHPEGHYAPHHDYLDKSVKTTVPTEGQRIFTVFTLVQTAKIGGTTVFPKLGLNIRPNVGDALVWSNMEVDAENDAESLHAACPIIDGIKIGATLWTRSVGQELRCPCSKDKKWLLEPFIRPKSTYWDRSLFCKPPGPE